MFLAYPYTDLYNLNLDWMIKAIKEVQEVIENLGSVVNTFNEREGNVVLTSEDVNNLEIDSVVTLPEGSFDTITEAQKTAYYEAGKRIIVALNTFGDYSKLGFLYKAGAAVGMAEYVPTPAEYAVLSFNGRTGQVTLTDTDINNLQIKPVLQLNGVDVSSLSTAQKLQYFDAGIRFVHCVPIQGGTLTTQKLYTLNVNESGGTRIPVLALYDPLQGQGLVKAVNSESPNNAGQVYLYADDIDMANDDDDTVYERITNLESAAVKSVNGITPTQGAVEITGTSIQVASDDDTTIDDFAVDVYSELGDRVKSVNGVTPTSGAVTLTGGDIAVASDDATKIDEALANRVVVEDTAVAFHVFRGETITTDETTPWKGVFNYFDSFNLYTGKSVIFSGIITYNSSACQINGILNSTHTLYTIKLTRWFTHPFEIILTKPTTNVYNVDIASSDKIFAKESTAIDGTSSIAVSKGEYFINAGRLCKAIANIAIGDALGTNNRTIVSNGGFNDIKQAVFKNNKPDTPIEINANNYNTNITAAANSLISITGNTSATDETETRFNITMVATENWQYAVLCVNNVVYSVPVRTYSNILRVSKLKPLDATATINWYITEVNVL